MTSRERWILYPLLFLTLGTVMRDKFFPFTAPGISVREIHAQRIRCRYLDVDGEVECRAMAVSGPTGKEAARIGVLTNGGGRLELRGNHGKIVAAAGSDDTGRSGLVETLDSDGRPQARLWSRECGGMVTTIGANRKIWLTLGHFGQGHGVFAESAALGRRMLLTLPWRFDTRADQP